MKKPFPVAAHIWTIVALVAAVGWPGTSPPSAHAQPSSSLPSLPSLPSFPSPSSPPPPHLGYGLNVCDPSVVGSLFTPLGFEWLKLWEEYGVRDSSLRSE